MKCPGQDRRDIKASLHPCPDCGYMVELFSDEMHARCRRCGARVERESVPSCIQWCKAAKQCLGEERLKRVMEALGRPVEEKREGGS
jgi:DNA-directed RNA polymerase subunit RPC12/RpoP